MVSRMGQRVFVRCCTLGTGRYSDTSQGLFRPYLGPAHRATLEQLAQWMREAGMAPRLDSAGNLIGRYEGSQPKAKALLIGSHIDSVRDAGRFDGPLGVLLAIECVARFREIDRRFPFAIEVIAFGDEEGSRFPASMLCSRAVAGLVNESDLQVADGDGVKLDDALKSFGLSMDRFLDAKRSADELVAYMEAHIEQGPILESEGLALGIVSSIAAQRRCAITLTGYAGHAGTTPMQLRQDALAAAAESILAIERIAKEGADDLVATVGRLETYPGAANVIPGKVYFTLDVRSGNQQTRDDAVRRILKEIEAISFQRGIQFSQELIHDLPSCQSDAILAEKLGNALQSIGCEPRRMVSGAGHDAMAMAKIAPMIMLFVRCCRGISHHPSESVDVEDVGLAARAMMAWIEQLEKEKQS